MGTDDTCKSAGRYCSDTSDAYFRWCMARMYNYGGQLASSDWTRNFYVSGGAELTRVKLDEARFNPYWNIDSIEVV